MPRFAASAVPHGGLVLPALLTYFKGAYHVTRILQMCMDWRDWSAAGHIHNLLGNFNQAFGPAFPVLMCTQSRSAVPAVDGGTLRRLR